MVVISYGLTKSGSTLAFELCKSLLTEAGYSQRLLPETIRAPEESVNFAAMVTLPWLERVLNEVKDDEIIAIKTHTNLRPPERMFIRQAIENGKMRLHVNFRDPREIALSLLDAGKTARENNWAAFAEFATLSDAAAEVGRQLTKCRRWGAVKGALHLYYNDVAFDPEATVTRMAADFGFPALDPEQIQRVVARVFKDTFTQKNKGIKDRYKQDLSPEEADRLLSEIPDGRRFVNKVCKQRDYSWFRIIQPGKNRRAHGRLPGGNMVSKAGKTK
ncbi:MAG TPA: hypothetical protein VHE81_00405 [Lacipirellulaceae bacterium]|nr:hypothetical protein [Lacipirellulaceae bacterium]